MKSAVCSNFPEQLRAMFALVLLAILAAVVSSPGYAIQNCHDYTYYALTGENGNMLSVGKLREYLEKNGYTKFKYPSSRALLAGSNRPMTESEILRPGDVLIFGDSHSGVVNATGTVDQYFQSFVSGQLPRKSEQVDPRDLDYQKTLQKGWTVERILKEKKVYQEDQIEIWRKESDFNNVLRFVRSPTASGDSYSTTDYTVTKDAGQVSLKVVREGGGKGPVTARIVADPYSSASAGRTYTLSNDTLTWAHNDLSTKDVFVTVRDDDQEPGDRFVIFALKLVSGNVRLAAPSNAMVSIKKPYTSQDRDSMGGEISFTEDQVHADAKDTRVRLVVTREGFTKGAVTVEYQSQDGTAHSGMDYTPVAGTLSWEESDNTIRSIEIRLLPGTRSPTDVAFTVSLKNPTAGAQIANPSKVTVSMRGRSANSGQAVTSQSVSPTEQEAERSPPFVPPPVRQKECRYLKISPDNVEVGSGRQVSFQATAVYDDGSEAVVTTKATWQPGPGSTYTAPSDLRVNQRVTITATWDNCEGKTTLNALAPSWSPPLSHADELGARGETPGPSDYTHYVLCDQTGHVVTGTSTNPVLFGIMAGPFPGPREAELWIPKNCPRGLCTKEGAYGLCAKEPPLAPTGGDAYYALCDQTGHVVISRSASLTGHVIMSPALTGEAGARWWIEQNCPSWACTSAGACASAGQIRTGGKWAVVCDRRHGGVGLTEYPNSVDHWIWVEHLLTDGDAKNWIAKNCPSERCDQNGRCLPGNAAQGRPLEMPPEAVLEMFSQRESSRQAGGRGGVVIGGGTRPGRFSATDLQSGGGLLTDSGGSVTGTGTSTGTTTGTTTSTTTGTGTKTEPVAPVKPVTPTGGTGGTTKPPAVPSGTYEPKGSGQPCLQVGQQMEAQCRQMGEDCNRRNCSGGGYSGCALDCPGCGGYFGDYVAWCPLHPSYEPKVSAGLTSFVGEIKTCINQFLGDGKPGRRERGAECQGKAQKKLSESKDTWVQQACQARCAQDGRSGVAVLGGARHRCECR